MNVGELTNDQLKRAITGRLRTGELELLIREAGKRGLDIEVDYDDVSEETADRETSLRLRIVFQALAVDTRR